MKGGRGVSIVRIVILKTLPETKSARTYRDLHRQITGGNYAPGQNLIRRDLVKKYGVSLSIVNEALARLAGDGLVESRENQSTRVIDLNPQQVRDDAMLREAVERQVVCILVETASDEILNTILQDAQVLDRWIASEGPESSLHLEFHLKMARATGYPSLEKTLLRTGIRALMTSRWLRNQIIPHPVDFHEQLIRSFLLRDRMAADAAIRAHLQFGWPMDEAARL